jgi:hypothetical protein
LIFWILVYQFLFSFRKCILIFWITIITKHISEKLLVIKLMMLIMAILSIIMARIREDSHTLKIIGIQGDYVILAMHTLITITISILF